MFSVTPSPTLMKAGQPLWEVERPRGQPAACDHTAHRWPRSTRDVTRPVTFAVTVTPTSESRIEGLATATFPYRDFNLAIPDAPSVDTVADDVTVELKFVAVAQ